MSTAWQVILKAGGVSVEIPNVIDVIAESGDLKRIGFSGSTYGATVRVRVFRYSGPGSTAQGVLTCVNAGSKYILSGAVLTKVEDINLGVMELTFKAASDDEVNSPLVSVAY